MSAGMIYIFTGEGKGKTSAALGVGLRASLSGLKVAMVQWYKDPAWKISEHQIPTRLDNFSIYPMGLGFHLKSGSTAPLKTGQIVVDKATLSEHQQAAAKAYAQAVNLCPQVDLLIADEIINAVHDGLLTENQVIDLIKSRGQTHLVLTGRDATPLMIESADLVTNMTKVKHPFDLGYPAVKGLDF